MAFGLSEALKEIEGSRTEIQKLLKEQRLTNGLLKLLLLEQSKEETHMLKQIHCLEKKIFEEQ